jgi:hypothetical protein
MATYWLSSARCRRARAPQGSTNSVAGPQSNPAPALALAPRPSQQVGPHNLDASLRHLGAAERQPLTSTMVTRHAHAAVIVSTLLVLQGTDYGLPKEHHRA